MVPYLRTSSKAPNQSPQDNQQERGISNQVGHPRNKLYREFLQDRLPWNKICLDKGKVNYSRNSIVETSYLKETLEELGLK